ncbi:MAG: ABC transporter substrate-binding protein [Gammaproteobacteria bacterium]|nr:ABC transporter substrate-binding protein [Gammaproteobacteria bacterium]MDH3508511.1 ABC transporter substrate-binding protein [Gammaproteobacteria bacterium]
MVQKNNRAELRLIAFPGAPNLPIFAGLEHGFFEAAGLDLEIETTPSSKYQIEALVTGRYDIAATAFDNVVAYREGQGAIELPTPPDLFVFMGATRIELSLVVAPEIREFADLRGKPLALDALATGFAFVLYHMLEQAGLALEDCELVPVGATPQRWQAVRDGAAAGTLTIEPFTSVAEAQGFHVLQSSRECLPDYQGGIFTASRAWAEAHETELAAFMRGYLDGLAWTLDPANYEAATALLLERMPAIKPRVAPAVMAKLLDPATGLTPGGAVDEAGMRTVLELRSRYAKPNKQLESTEPYLDLSSYANVTGNVPI